MYAIYNIRVSKFLYKFLSKLLTCLLLIYYRIEDFIK